MPLRVQTPVQILITLLRELATHIETIGEELYQRECTPADSGCVGGHVRHTLDHIRLFLDGLEQGLIDYDRRDRGVPIESDPHAALSHIEELIDRLSSLAFQSGRTLRLRALLQSDLGPFDLETSPEREIAFLISHTIHHNALIASMVRRMGGHVAESFGFAPATIAYQKSLH